MARILVAAILAVSAGWVFQFAQVGLTQSKTTRILGGLSWVLQAQQPVDELKVFDENFVDKTIRVDYFHSGGLGAEGLALDQIVSDGPWAGSRTRLIDHLNLGKYLFEVIDRPTNRVIYSRGFASIYGEWETTPAARQVHATFHESLRFPWPKRPVQVVLKVRSRVPLCQSNGPSFGGRGLADYRQWATF